MKIRETTVGLFVAVALLQGAPPKEVRESVKPTVAELTATLNENRDRATVSFRIENGLSEDALEKIHSGIAVDLSYRLRMTSKRWALFPRKEEARTRIEVVAAYDSLTGQYELTRTIEIRSGRKRDRPPPIVESRETTSRDEMRRWMTEFEEIPLYDPGHPFEGTGLRVKLDSDLGRRYVMLVFPATIDASAEFDLEE
jgi:hypothetical protein